METQENNSQQEITVNGTSQSIGEAEILVKEKDQIAESQIACSATEIHKKKSPWSFLGLAMVLIVAGVVWKGFTVSQSPSSPEQLETAAAQASLPVQAVRAKLNPIEAWVFSNGEVAAVHFKHLTFQTAGTITYLKKIAERDLREGDLVRGGELLAKIDQRKLNADVTVATAHQMEAKKGINNALADLQQAQAFLEAEKANLAQAEQNLAKVKSDLSKTETNRDFAKTDFIRYQELVAEGAMQEREMEVRETNYKAAESDVSAAQAGVKLAESQVKAAQARIEAAQGQLLAGQTQVETAEAGYVGPIQAYERDILHIQAAFDRVGIACYQV